MVYLCVPRVELVELDPIFFTKVDTVVVSFNSMILGTFGTLDQFNSGDIIGDGSGVFVTFNKFKIRFRNAFITKSREIIIRVSLRSYIDIISDDLLS